MPLIDLSFPAAPPSQTVSQLDFCPSVRQPIARRSVLGSGPRPLFRPRGPGQTGAFPGLTARVLSTPAAQPLGETTTVPPVHGGRT
jgi:hypothetical protein